MATLFNVGVPAVSKHLKSIFSSGKLEKNSVCRKFRRTASDGKQCNTQYFNLDPIALTTLVIYGDMNIKL